MASWPVLCGLHQGLHLLPSPAWGPQNGAHTLPRATGVPGVTPTEHSRAFERQTVLPNAQPVPATACGFVDSILIAAHGGVELTTSHTVPGDTLAHLDAHSRTVDAVVYLDGDT